MKTLDAQYPQHHQKTIHPFMDKVRIYTAATLMLFLFVEAKNDEKSLLMSSPDIGLLKEKSIKESLEINEERLFRSAVAQAVRPINDLKDIPVGGIPLKYPASYEGNLPKSIDFFPKSIKAKTLPHTIIRIGEKMFIITPDLGFVVDAMYLDKENFYVHVALGRIGKEITKSKEDKKKGLPEYLAKLYFQGETASYTMSTVHEVAPGYQAQALKILEHLNQ